MDRHEIVRVRPALVCLLGGLAIVGVWLAEHTGDSGLPADVNQRVAGVPATSSAPPAIVRDSSKSVDLNATRPRLFLARDRVRRLPPIAEPAEHVVSALVPDEGKSAVPAGPILLTPENVPMPAPESLPAPAEAAPPVTDVSRRVVLEPPAVDLADVMPECPTLGDPVPIVRTPIAPASIASTPASATRARSTLPTPAIGQTELPRAARQVAPPDAGEELGNNIDELFQTPSDKTTTKRSDQLEQIAREADRHTRRGFELAGRNAVFAARSQFIVALRLLAQGLDTEHETRAHSLALAEGLDAIREADDFIPRGARMEADLDLAVIVRGHRTPVLKQEPSAALTPMLALKAYFTFAQQRLAAAVDNEVAGSMALHGLGKLHGAAARNPAVELVAAEPKAVAFFQAALLVYPRNLMAANDLGVLLAQAGHWSGARQVLEHAVAVNPQSVSWRNLAKVYGQLEDAPRARHAQQMADAAARLETARRGGVSRSDMVQWLSPGAFAGTLVDSRVGPAPRTGQVLSSGPRLNRR